MTVKSKLIIYYILTIFGIVFWGYECTYLFGMWGTIPAFIGGWIAGTYILLPIIEELQSME